MSAKTDTQAIGRADTPKLIAAGAIVIAAVAAFYYYSDSSLLLRVLGMLVAIGIGVAIFMTTELGAQLRDFIRESRVELRKVVWPTRDETLKTSGIVLVLVFVMSVFLWLLDKFLFFIVRSLTG